MAKIREMENEGWFLTEEIWRNSVLKKADEGHLRDPFWQARNVVNIDGLTTSTEIVSPEPDSMVSYESFRYPLLSQFERGVDN